MKGPNRDGNRELWISDQSPLLSELGTRLRLSCIVLLGMLFSSVLRSVDTSDTHPPPPVPPVGEEDYNYHQHVFDESDTPPGHGEQIYLTGSDICQMTGYFVLPHPCNCQLFYTWYQGVFVENVCEPGLFFDSLTLNCVLPEEVTCADGFGPPPPIQNENDNAEVPPPDMSPVPEQE